MSEKMDKAGSSNFPINAKKYFVSLDGQQYEVFVDGDNKGNVTILSGEKDTTYKVEHKNDLRELVVSKGSRRFPISVDSENGRLSVFFGCREGKPEVKTERDLLYEKYRSTSEKEEKELKIISPLPGLVTKINIVSGLEVKKGESLLIIEAMKMENEIKAPRDSKVLEVNVEEGTAIDKGHVIAVLE